MLFPFATALLIGCAFPSARAQEVRPALRERFDQIIIPAVEKAVRQPITQQGGEIAWGESYQLAALVEMLDATRDPKYAELAVKLSDWIAKSRDDRQALRDEFRDKVVSAWSSTNYSQGRRYAWAVHTGMIVAPMARFAAVVREDAALKEKWSKDADRLLKIAEEATSVHDAEYREGPATDEGYVYCPYLKKHLPLNMQNALARAWLAIDDATKEPRHRERVVCGRWTMARMSGRIGRRSKVRSNPSRTSPTPRSMWTSWSCATNTGLFSPAMIWRAWRERC
jgi:hypothetical protein